MLIFTYPNKDKATHAEVT